MDILSLTDRIVRDDGGVALPVVRRRTTGTPLRHHNAPPPLRKQPPRGANAVVGVPTDEGENQDVDVDEDQEGSEELEDEEAAWRLAPEGSLLHPQAPPRLLQRVRPASTHRLTASALAPDGIHVAISDIQATRIFLSSVVDQDLRGIRTDQLPPASALLWLPRPSPPPLLSTGGAAMRSRSRSRSRSTSAPSSASTATPFTTQYLVLAGLNGGLTLYTVPRLDTDDAWVGAAPEQEKKKKTKGEGEGDEFVSSSSSSSSSWTARGRTLLTPTTMGFKRSAWSSSSSSSSLSLSLSSSSSPPSAPPGPIETLATDPTGRWLVAC